MTKRHSPALIEIDADHDVRPSECVPGGAAVDVGLRVGGSPVEVTFALDHEGELVPYGDSLDTWISDPSVLPADRDDRHAIVARIVEAVRGAVAAHEATYRIEVRDGSWGPAPGDAHGWALLGALHACAGGILGHDGTPVASDCVRLTTESALDRLVDASDSTLYRTVGELLELTEAGIALAEGADLRVDVDSYGCAYCVEAVEDERWGVTLRRR